MNEFSMDYMARVYVGVIGTKEKNTKEEIVLLSKENEQFGNKFTKAMNSFLTNYFFMREAELNRKWDEQDKLREECIADGKEAKEIVKFYTEYSTVKAVKLRFNPEDFD